MTLIVANDVRRLQNFGTGAISTGPGRSKLPQAIGQLEPPDVVCYKQL